MTEKGSDELLAEVADPVELMAGVDDEQIRVDAEEDIVLQTPPEQDPAKQYPDPDEIPDGEPEEYDTNPPEAP